MHLLEQLPLEIELSALVAGKILAREVIAAKVYGVVEHPVREDAPIVGKAPDEIQFPCADLPAGEHLLMDVPYVLLRIGDSVDESEQHDGGKRVYHHLALPERHLHEHCGSCEDKVESERPNKQPEIPREGRPDEGHEDEEGEEPRACHEKAGPVVVNTAHIRIVSREDMQRVPRRDMQHLPTGLDE